MLTKKKLDKLIEEATVDAYNDSEQACGFLTMIEEHIRCPFNAKVVGEVVEVMGFDLLGTARAFKRFVFATGKSTKSMSRAWNGLLDLPKARNGLEPTRFGSTLGETV